MNDYRANVESDVILYGRQLQNGMRVLLEESDRRRSALRNSKNTDRWCIVTQLVQTPFFTKFVGLYEDGTLGHREEMNTVPWIVKKDSIPKAAKPISGWRKFFG